MARKKRKFYVVWRGRQPGIYTSWAACEAQVKGFPEAQFKGYPSRATAENGLQTAPYVLWDGDTPGVYVGWDALKPHLQGLEEPAYRVFENEQTAWEAFGDEEKRGRNQRKLPPAPEPIVDLDEVGGWLADSWAVDAACSGNPGVLEYRGVATATREPLFHQGPFPQGTSNVGEFLAIVHALALLHQRGDERAIYSDSKIARGWVRRGRCRTQLAETEENEPLFELIRRAEAWLETHSYVNPILKWETAAWGEIPADFGRK